jgi:hypothetical protein
MESIAAQMQKISDQSEFLASTIRVRDLYYSLGMNFTLDICGNKTVQNP